jgi:putative glycosyltransferase (TIGR04372 family)
VISRPNIRVSSDRDLKQPRLWLPAIGRSLSESWRGAHSRIVHFACRVLAYPLRRLGVRFLKVAHPDRIGHLALDIDCFLKAGKLGLRERIFPVLLCTREQAANPHLLDYWRPHLLVISSRFWGRVLGCLAPYLVFETHPYTVAIDDTAEYYSLQTRWGDRAPLLRLSDEDREFGWRRLATLGMPRNAWFVCIHSREGGYSPADEHLHSYRNSDIDTYLLAAREIVARGGWCVRMGDPSMKPLPDIPGVVDYAHSAIRSSAMDVFLCASCRFFLGNTSGLIFLSCVFGVPVAQANCIPVSATLPFGPKDIGIPKLLWSATDNRYLSFPELFRSSVANFRFSKLYSEQNIEVRDNSPEDIRALAVEMLERTTGTPFIYSDADEGLQREFRELFKPGHQSFGSSAQIGRDFLAKYAFLLTHRP